MPVISQFYGIIIRMYFKDTEQHYLAHIHIQYNEFDAVYSIEDNKILEGMLPIKQQKLVTAWIEIHKEELKALWKVCQNDGEIFKIAPLQALDDFFIKITYVNGEEKLYDMKKNLQEEFYKNLKNIAYFKLVKSVGVTVEWTNGEDIDPNELYENSKLIK